MSTIDPTLTTLQSRVSECINGIPYASSAGPAIDPMLAVCETDILAALNTEAKQTRLDSADRQTLFNIANSLTAGWKAVAGGNPSANEAQIRQLAVDQLAVLADAISPDHAARYLSDSARRETDPIVLAHMAYALQAIATGYSLLPDVRQEVLTTLSGMTGSTQPNPGVRIAAQVAYNAIAAKATPTPDLDTIDVAGAKTSRPWLVPVIAIGATLAISGSLLYATFRKSYLHLHGGHKRRRLSRRLSQRI